MIKAKYIRSIKENNVFYREEEKNSYNKLKKDCELSTQTQDITFLDFCKENTESSLEIELVVLPSFKPDMKMSFGSGYILREPNLSFDNEIFFLKKSTIICSHSLPTFKRRNLFQCEILKIESIFKKFKEVDKILMEELFDKKKNLKPKFPFQIQEKYFLSYKKQKIFSNGFLEFRKSDSIMNKNLFFRGVIKNNSLIRFNTGPEFRFTFRC